MLNYIALMLGLLVCLPALFMLSYHGVRLVLVFFFGSNVTIRYVDKAGVGRSVRLNYSRDEDLAEAVAVLKNRGRRSGRAAS